jgi:murein DD-endopeptidase MepM/ murein hydrolase activator NlpD
VGTPVVAAATGTVSLHRDPAGLGDFLKLRSLADPDRAYLYGHLSQREPAGFYCAGNTIGKTGTTGNASADRPHLHLQLQTNGNNVDPVAEFAADNGHRANRHFRNRD